MKPEIKQKWVAALRSGRYYQGKGFLKRIEDDVPRFCCLGVLCDIARQEGIGEWSHPYGNIYLFESEDYDDDISPVPPVVEWADLPDCDPDVVIIEEGQERNVTLSDLNDNIGYNFSQIADLVEAQL